MKFLSLLAACAAALSLSVSSPATADNHGGAVKLGDLVITKVWARPTPKTAKTTAAYFMIKNTGKTDDVLSGAASTISKKTEIHETKITDGVMKMNHVGRIAIPAGGMAMLKPGGFHIMFMGLHAPIADKQTFKLNLTFEKAGSVELDVTASKAMASKAMGAMKGMKHGHGDMKKN